MLVALFLWTLQRILFGAALLEFAHLPPLARREVSVMLPLVLLVLALGILPGPLTTAITGALHGTLFGPLSGTH